MPFSFPARGVIPGAGNGSVGHLGPLHAKRRDVNVNTKENNPVAVSGSTPLVLRSHQDLPGLSRKNSVFESRLGTFSSSWEDGY